MRLLNEASNSQASRSLSPSVLENNNNNKECIQSLLELAQSNVFPLVEVKIGGKVKEYSSVLNWFNFVEKFNKPVPKTINFECIVCGKKSIGELGKPGNKYKHIKTHKVGADWSDLYEIFKEEVKAKPKKILDKKQLNLVKFFITSNVALEALENPWLRECINVKLSKYSFRNVILPNMMIFLNTIISNKLIDA